MYTKFSLLDGMSGIKKLVSRASETGMDALAITDHGTMCSVIGFYRACKSAGIKPIIGMEAYLARRSMYDRDPQMDARPYHLLLLARNETGYKNLLKIASVSQLEGYYYRPRIDRDFLAEHAEGLIATSGCLAAEIPRMVEEGRETEALRQIGWYGTCSGRRISSGASAPQHRGTSPAQQVAARQSGLRRVPLVATNDVHYVLDEDYNARHAALHQTGSLKSDPNRMRFSSRSFHLRTPEEMWRLFADVPEALTNTRLIARCATSAWSRTAIICRFPGAGWLHARDVPAPPLRARAALALWQPRGRPESASGSASAPPRSTTWVSTRIS